MVTKQSNETGAAKVPNVIEVTDFCKRLNLDAELVGRWVWVSFPETPSKEIRKALKAFGFRWSGKRQKWAHNCGHPSLVGQADPRTKYPCRAVSKHVEPEQPSRSVSYSEMAAHQKRERTERFKRIDNVKDKFYQQKGA